MPKREVTGCCYDFKRAQEKGTDNEGYGRLIMSYANDGVYHIGSGLSSIEFCPWCGKPVKEQPS